MRFLDFTVFCYFLLLFLFKVTKVPTKHFGGYYWTPKMALNKHKQHEKLSFFARRAKKALAKRWSPSQELEVSPRSRLYLLVDVIMNLVIDQYNAVNFSTDLQNGANPHTKFVCKTFVMTRAMPGAALQTLPSLIHSCIKLVILWWSLWRRHALMVKDCAFSHKMGYVSFLTDPV